MLPPSLVQWRQWLSNPPSLPLWNTLMTALEEVPQEELPMLLEYLQSHLAHWPGHLKPRGLRREDHPGWELFSHFRIDGHSIHSNQLFLNFRKNLYRHAESLEFRSTPFTGSLMQALADTEMPALKHLSLMFRELDASSLRLLGKAAWLPQLESLTLVENGLTQRHLDFLYEPKEELNLRKLSLVRQTSLGDGVGTFLSKNRRLSSLTHLELNDCRLGGEGLEPLLESPYFTLKELRLSNNRLGSYLSSGAGYFRDFAANPALRSLHTLDLSTNFLRPPDCKLLLESPYLTDLKSLNLSGNPIKEEGAHAFVQLTTDLSLEKLFLNGCHLRKQGLLALARTRVLKKLKHLELSSNFLHNDIAEALARSEGFPELRHLRISSNFLTTSGITTLLSKKSNMKQLQSVDFSENDLREYRLIELARKNPLPSLRKLAFRHCGLTGKAALDLAEASWLSQLETLDLGFNPIPRHAVQEFSSLVPETLQLDFSHNQLPPPHGGR